MSRIGTRKIKIPQNVEVNVKNGFVTVKGPKGELVSIQLKDVNIEIKDNIVITNPVNPNKKFSYAMSGTANSLIMNMIQGVTKGYSKSLEISGVGYRALLKGNILTLTLGLSYIVEMPIPKGLKVEVPKPTRVVISGIDKQLVTQFAAQIRQKRKAEPYKGKGIRYSDERIIRKEGKKAGK